MDSLPPPPPRRSRWPLILCVLLGLGLLCSLFMNFALGLAFVGTHGDKARGFNSRVVDGEEDEKDFIAIVPVQGMILEPPSDNPDKGSYGQFTALLKDLGEMDNLKGILLVVDSPGGGVTASDRMYDALKRFKKEKNLPVVALFEDIAASGGYYVAMASDHIIAHPTTLTGSIGVISHFYNVSELIDKVGVKVNTIKSLNDQGKESMKDIGSPYRPMRPEERALMQSVITEMWGRFTSVVAEGRKGKLTPEQVRKLADGRVFTGQQALQAKLVDQVGYEPEAYAKIRELCGNKNAKIVAFTPERSWADLFSAETERFAPQSLLPPARIMYLWDPR